MNALAPFSGPTIERLGWILIHSLWQFTLTAIVVVAVMRTMRRRSAAARYVVLILSMSAAVLLPIVTWTRQSAPAPIEQIDAVEPLRPVDAIPPALEPAVPRDPIVPGGQPLPVAVDPPAVERVDPPPAARDVPPTELAWTERIHNFFEPYLAWIVGGWTVGVMLCALRPLFGWYMLRRLKRVGTSPVADSVAAAVKRLSQQLGITRSVGVMQSTLARVPVVVGYFRPVILLPASILTSIPPSSSMRSWLTSWPTSAGTISSSTCCKRWSRRCSSTTPRSGGCHDRSASNANTAATTW